jgi:uncharacterized protein YecE (DUF72 family)
VTKQPAGWNDAMNLRIGISGWRYGPWRGTFYPEDLAQKRELEYASRQINSIEINGTHYSLQRPSSFKRWYDETPEGFVFAVKGSRYITHMKRLKGIETPLANFFASGLLLLKEKLGPFLWQFPPNMQFDEALFEHFLQMLPKDTQAAARLARRHDEKLKHGAHTRGNGRRPLRHAVEIRHESFRDAKFVRLLRRHDAALVIADTAGKWPLIEDITASFVYIRLHGDKQIYVSGYTPRALDRWAERIRLWRDGREPPDARKVLDAAAPKRKHRNIYVYFDNDVKVRAPVDAINLMKRLDEQ